MKASPAADQRPTTRTRTRYWPDRQREKREKDIEVFVRSVLEIIRQRPGIRRGELRSMYTKRERVFVDAALLRLRSDYRVVWKEDDKSPKLYMQQ